MVRYLLRRFLLILVTMWLASMLIFTATQLMPTDVAQNILGRWATEEALENLREKLGLNRPAYVQYLDWISHFVRGDWGKSLTSGQDAQTLILERLRNSSMLAALSFFTYMPLGVSLGVMAALRRDSAFDKVTSAASMAIAGLPEFVTGLILISFVSLSFGLLPANSSIQPGANFFEALPQLILPAITVSLVLLGYIARMARASTIEVLQSDYTRAAYLKGLPRRMVLVKHVLRNALLPTVTVAALSVGWLIGGLIVTESVFGYPGVGRLLVYSIQRQDLTLIQGCAMLIVVVYGVLNLLADLLYAVLNPRIRLG